MTSIAIPAGSASVNSHDYRPDIDGLRALAIGTVVLFHAFAQFLPGGFVGVDVFFVISGFLISGLILGGLEAGTFRIKRFYARRIRRIFPALLLVMTACLLYGWMVLTASEYRQLGTHVAGGAAFLDNLLFWHVQDRCAYRPD
jgi:peptidoglycan/LPS O-acetylase OafA/YrhL